MALTITCETKNNVTKMTLVGRLDASTAPAFKAEIEKAAAQKCTVLALLLADLEYMASAGLRVLVVAKQRMGASARIFVIGPQEMVRQTLVLSGFHQAVIVLPSYDPAVIEKA